MKIPKCHKTVTGKHKFVDTSYKVYGTFPNFKGRYIMCNDIKGVIKCEYCGLIDDREEQK